MSEGGMFRKYDRVLFLGHLWVLFSLFDWSSLQYNAEQNLLWKPVSGMPVSVMSVLLCVFCRFGIQLDFEREPFAKVAEKALAACKVNQQLQQRP